MLPTVVRAVPDTLRCVGRVKRLGVARVRHRTGTGNRSNRSTIGPSSTLVGSECNPVENGLYRRRFFFFDKILFLCKQNATTTWTGRRLKLIRCGFAEDSIIAMIILNRSRIRPLLGYGSVFLNPSTSQGIEKPLRQPGSNLRRTHTVLLKWKILHKTTLDQIFSSRQTADALPVKFRFFLHFSFNRLRNSLVYLVHLIVRPTNEDYSHFSV